MDVSSKYCIYVGTARGILEYTTCNPKEKVQYEISGESCEITRMEWGHPENLIFVGFKNGMVKVFDTNINKFVSKCEKLEGRGPVVGIGKVQKSIAIGMHDGIVNLWDGKRNEFFELSLDEESTLDCLKVNESRENVIGTGGEKNDFKLWDVNTQQCIFTAKSLGHDELNLPIPTSVRGISFFSEDAHLSACATKQGHVLLYDDRAQRRPIVKFLETKASYTTIATAHRQRQCLVGTTKGYIQLLDMKAGKCLKVFKSFTGSVTSIACDPVDPFVVSTSLDRYVRIHNLDTKELAYKAYLKQNLTVLLMKPYLKQETEDCEKSSEDTNIDQEYEDLFDCMEVISDAPKRKQKSLVTPTKKKKKIK